MFWWKLKHRITRWAPSAGKFLALAVAAAFNLYFLQYWAVHSGVWHRAARWAHHSLRPPVSPVADAAFPYEKAFAHCMTRLRADRRVPIFAYDFPAEALRYQLAPADGGWRLQARFPLLGGLAIPRAFRQVLDQEGIVYIDPQVAPVAALENPGTPMKVATLRQYFLLVPDVAGHRRGNYRIVPTRLLGSRAPMRAEIK